MILRWGSSTDPRPPALISSKHPSSKPRYYAYKQPYFVHHKTAQAPANNLANPKHHKPKDKKNNRKRMGNLCSSEREPFSQPGRPLGSTPAAPTSASVPASAKAPRKVGGPPRTLGGSSSSGGEAGPGSSSSAAAGDARAKAAAAAEVCFSSSSPPVSSTSCHVVIISCHLTPCHPPLPPNRYTRSIPTYIHTYPVTNGMMCPVHMLTIIPTPGTPPTKPKGHRQAADSPGPAARHDGCRGAQARERDGAAAAGSGPECECVELQLIASLFNGVGGCRGAAAGGCYGLSGSGLGWVGVGVGLGSLLLLEPCSVVDCVGYCVWCRDGSFKQATGVRTDTSV